MGPGSAGCLPNSDAWGAVESVNVSKLNSEACSDSMETVNEELTGNSKTTVVEIVCVTKCHFTLDLY